MLAQSRGRWSDCTTSQGDEGREDAEVAVREVDQTHDAEDQSEADGEESVQAAQKDPLQNAC